MDLNEQVNLLPHDGTSPRVAEVCLGRARSLRHRRRTPGRGVRAFGTGPCCAATRSPSALGPGPTCRTGVSCTLTPAILQSSARAASSAYNAVVHGCEIGDDCLVGMGATILNGAKIGDGSIVAAGAVVPEGREFPPRSLIVGIPANHIGDVTDEQAADIQRGASEYVERASAHRVSLGGG